MFSMLIFGFRKAAAENTAVLLNYPLLPSSFPLNIFFHIYIKNQAFFHEYNLKFSIEK